MPPQSTNLGKDAVCAHHYSDKCDEYTIVSYNSSEEAKAAGGVITHFGKCGTCSTRQDLGVYMKYPDMTSVGKTCGIKTLYSMSSSIKCFEDLGMTAPCARIWADNAQYDSKNCVVLCLAQYFSAYNGAYPKCELNACLACDEKFAGPIFQKVAGRTRRNTGLESAITRPCEFVQQLDHELCPASSLIKDKAQKVYNN